MNTKLKFLILFSSVLVFGLTKFWTYNQTQDDVGSVSTQEKTDESPEEGVAPAITQQNAILTLGEEQSAAATAEKKDSNIELEVFNEEAKRKVVADLVEKGAAYFQGHPIDEIGNAFSHTKEFVKGEVYLFVYDLSGICLAHGQESSLIYTNMINYKDEFGTFVIQRLIDKAKSGGGWITYEWRKAVKDAYVKMVIKDEKSYVVGSGYYPHSKKDAVVSLVKAAAAVFKQEISTGRGALEIFAELSYPLGRYVYGDLYLYALDFNGMIVAQGDRPGLIGTNALEAKADGKLVNQEIINKLKETTEGIWVEYTSKNATKETYAERVQDKAGVNYFIACGYYPEADRNKVLELVRKGYQFVKAQGLTQASDEFTDKQNMTFRYGDLFLFLYDMKGKCLAHGGNEEFVGQNQYNLTDEDGDYYIRELIKKAQSGGGWVDIKRNNSFASVYVEKITVGIEDYVIGSGLYPISKRETMLLLAKSAAGYLRVNDTFQSLGLFVKPDSRFIRGDLFVFVFDEGGICYAYGDQVDLIWRNLFNLKDDDNREFVKTMINTASHGSGTLKYRLNGTPVQAYVELVEKDGNKYVVGSSNFL